MMENEQRLDTTDISVSIYDTSLISNILQIALDNITLDEPSRKRVQDFRLKLNKAGLEISKRYLESLQHP